ncbi:DUF6134 family protein [Magnetovibrio sp.]|uniref:DUF6134 family protein n=1 Tax=Magnetovibrio sp. TaxID=2024836 RepID=UPI002F94B765
MKTLIRSVAFAMAAVVATATWQAHAANKTLAFTVLRDGSNIGTHSYAISEHGDETLVEVNTDIEVKVLFMTAYKFIHASKEVWKNGKLVQLNSTTDDDGTAKSLNVKAQGDTLTADSVVAGQDRRQNAAPTVIPASLWKQDIVKQSAVLNTLDGTLMNIKVEDLGAEEVEAGGAKIEAQHYSITGELTRELWFSGAGDLVRVRFPDKTGSEIVYALK